MIVIFNLSNVVLDSCRHSLQRKRFFILIDWNSNNRNPAYLTMYNAPPDIVSLHIRCDGSCMMNIFKTINVVLDSCWCSLQKQRLFHFSWLEPKICAKKTRKVRTIEWEARTHTHTQTTKKCSISADNTIQRCFHSHSREDYFSKTWRKLWGTSPQSNYVVICLLVCLSFLSQMLLPSMEGMSIWWHWGHNLDHRTASKAPKHNGNGHRRQQPTWSTPQEVSPLLNNYRRVLCLASARMTQNTTIAQLWKFTLPME